MAISWLRQLVTDLLTMKARVHVWARPCRISGRQE